MTAAVIAFARSGHPGWAATGATDSFQVFGGGATEQPDEQDVMRVWDGLAGS